MALFLFFELLLNMPLYWLGNVDQVEATNQAGRQIYSKII
jgi:hypothetical protein